jgi:hypothetical protein
MTTTDLRPEYLESNYRVHLGPDRDVVLHHGQLHPELDAWIADAHPEFRHWALVTAWNPGSEPRPRDENERAQQKLREEVRAQGWPFVEAVGENENWREESLLVLVPSREDGLDLGQRFQQAAVVLGCRAELAEVTLSVSPENEAPGMAG